MTVKVLSDDDRVTIMTAGQRRTKMDPADRIWVWTKQDRHHNKSWYMADKAEWVPKSDGRPKALKCYFTTYGSGWTSRVALQNVYCDTRNVIGVVAIKITPRMLAQGGWQEWEYLFPKELVRMGYDLMPPPPAPHDDDDDVFIDDGDDDP